MGCGSKEPPVEIETFEQYNQLLYSNSKFLKITSLVDSVTITKIIPNRGKCKIGGVLDNRDIKINKTLKYGEVWNYIPLRGCDKLLEVRVETDQGEWDFKF
ncbi:hypothetical protein [Campylobacter sp. US33a]|uniref:Lipoprotein n=1 Tax=Campylobacter sp. CCS1377 TaxID=3158229 RepID=A0AAU7E8S6_9BACT|nr:hypothetical protein [Campylobacter sp. US33a]MCW1359776.1 hypothetical protein [Campylobacter jejuni]TEY04607.1 hypothetical protein ELQ16_00870 [Campylobacter sp. US33a]